jgi:transposase
MIQGQSERVNREGFGLDSGSSAAPTEDCSKGGDESVGPRVAKEGVTIDWEKLLPPKGFKVLPRRWVVKRTFSWLGQNRRLSKDYERLCEKSEAFIHVAMIRLMVRRQAHR